MSIFGSFLCSNFPDESLKSAAAPGSGLVPQHQTEEVAADGLRSTIYQLQHQLREANVSIGELRQERQSILAAAKLPVNFSAKIGAYAAGMAPPDVTRHLDEYYTLLEGWAGTMLQPKSAAAVRELRLANFDSDVPLLASVLLDESAACARVHRANKHVPTLMLMHLASRSLFDLLDHYNRKGTGKYDRSYGGSSGGVGDQPEGAAHHGSASSGAAAQHGLLALDGYCQADLRLLMDERLGQPGSAVADKVVDLRATWLKDAYDRLKALPPAEAMFMQLAAATFGAAYEKISGNIMCSEGHELAACAVREAVLADTLRAAIGTLVFRYTNVASRIGSLDGRARTAPGDEHEVVREVYGSVPDGEADILLSLCPLLLREVDNQLYNRERVAELVPLSYIV